MPDARETAPLVSVVVPVFDPGSAIEPCIRSLLEQTLRPGQLELLFVDDGSTDGTAERLDALAATHPHVRVIHEPNSGWAGRPRNVGIEQARGRYIQFVDQDDRLAPEAVERCAAMAERHGTDIVLGKVTSDFRGVPHGVWTRDRERCTVFDAPLIDSLTPHKLFRRAFLLDREIRFPEGRRRLEDQLFMVRAYLAEAAASILATYPCYYYLRRADGANAGSAMIDPTGYQTNLREVLDVVTSRTSPGPDRDRLLARFLRVELLGRLEHDILGGDDAYRRRLVDEVRTTIERTMTPGAASGLGPLAATRLSLLRAGEVAPLVELSRRTTALRGSARLLSARWRRGRVEAFVEASVQGPDGATVALRTEGDRRWLDPSLTAGILDTPIDVTASAASPRLHAYLVSTTDGVHWRAMEREVRLAGDGTELVVRARVVVDLATVGAGTPLPDGSWRLRLRVTAAGLDRWADVEMAAAAADEGRVAPLVAGALEPDRPVRVVAIQDRPILEVGTTWRSVVAGGRIGHRPSGGRTLVAVLPVGAHPREGGSRTVAASLAGVAGVTRRDARLERQVDAWTVALDIGPIRGRLARGSYRVTVALDGPDEPPIELGTATADRLGRVTWAGGRRLGPAGIVRRDVGRLARAGAAAVRQVVRRVRSRRSPGGQGAGG